MNALELSLILYYIFSTLLFFGRITCVFRVVVLLHHPLSDERQFMDRYLDRFLQNFLVQIRIRRSANGDKLLWSKGSKAGPNYDTATSMFHTWDNVECSVCSSPNIMLFIQPQSSTLIHPRNILPLASWLIHMALRKLQMGNNALSGKQQFSPCNSAISLLFSVRLNGELLKIDISHCKIRLYLPRSYLRITCDLRDYYMPWF